MPSNTPKTVPHPLSEQIKQQARGQWGVLLTTLCFLDGSLLDGNGHPCPLCGGTDRFSVFPDFAETGGMNCRHCHHKQNSDGIASVQWLMDCDFKTAIKTLAEYLGIEENSKKVLENDTLVSTETVLCDPELCDKIYRTLLERMRLCQAHQKQLQARGLTDDQIHANGYRSLLGWGERKSAATQVAKQFGKESLLQVPGFYCDESNGLLIAGMQGILIPVRDCQERIIALKIRASKKDANPKYTYLSSKKYGGVSPGSQVHIPLKTKTCSETVRITEGELKADIATALSGIPTLSIPGVGQWKKVLPILRELQAQQVLVAFDSDWRTNADVCRALSGLIKQLEQDEIPFLVEDWTEQSGKGIDDVLAQGGTPNFLVPEEAISQVGTSFDRWNKTDPERSSVVERLSAADTRSRLIENLENSGPVAMYDDEQLMVSLAELSYTDPPAFAACKTIAESHGVKSRTFDKSLRRLIEDLQCKLQAKMMRGPRGGYFVSDGCICRSKLTSDGPQTIPLCTFEAWIRSETIRDDGVEQRVVLSLEGKHCEGRHLPVVQVSAEQFPNLEWIVPFWGTESIVWPGEGKQLPAAIQALTDRKELTRNTVYTHTGWSRLIANGSTFMETERLETARFSRIRQLNFRVQ